MELRAIRVLAFNGGKGGRVVMECGPVNITYRIVKSKKGELYAFAPSEKSFDGTKDYDLVTFKDRALSDAVKRTAINAYKEKAGEPVDEEAPF